MKFDFLNRAAAQFARRRDANEATRPSRSTTSPRTVVAAVAVTLLCGGLAIARDDDDDDRGGGRGNPAQLRQFIDRQVGGIQKLTVPADNASIPLPSIQTRK